MTERIPGGTWTPIEGRAGGSYVATNAPWRLVLHSTEGDTIASAVAAYRAAGTPPHATVDPLRRQIADHVGLERSAYALRNKAGGVETGRLRCIQVEIVGRAAAMHNLPADALAWLGSAVLRPILALRPITTDHPRFVGTEAGTIATETAPQRMSAAAWAAFGGICGHQHVPENNHWDPGRLDVDAIIRAALGTPPPPTGDTSDMLKKVKTSDTGATYTLDGETFAGASSPANKLWVVGEFRRPLADESDLRDLERIGLLDPATYPVELATLRGIPRLPGS